MLKIRLTRVGRRHDPTFRVIVTDSRKSPRSGAYLENLGFWNSRQNERKLDAERIKYWISNGAQVSDTVHNLLVSEKIIDAPKINVSAKSKKEAPAETEASADVSDEASAKPEENAAETEASAEAEPVATEDSTKDESEDLAKEAEDSSAESTEQKEEKEEIEEDKSAESESADEKKEEKS